MRKLFIGIALTCCYITNVFGIAAYKEYKDKNGNGSGNYYCSVRCNHPNNAANHIKSPVTSEEDCFKFATSVCGEDNWSTVSKGDGLYFDGGNNFDSHSKDSLPTGEEDELIEESLE